MPDEMRDKEILTIILEWCQQVEEAHKMFNRSYESFLSISVYRNAVSMCMEQIGEMSKRLSDGFKNNHQELQWPEIKGMREHFAHDYSNMNQFIIWETSISDVPILEKFCKEQIASDS